MLALVRTVLYAAFVRPDDDWVSRVVVSEGKIISSTGWNVETGSGWNVVGYGSRLERRPEWQQAGVLSGRGWVRLLVWTESAEGKFSCKPNTCSLQGRINGRNGITTSWHVYASAVSLQVFSSLVGSNLSVNGIATSKHKRTFGKGLELFRPLNWIDHSQVGS